MGSCGLLWGAQGMGRIVTPILYVYQQHDFLRIAAAYLLWIRTSVWTLNPRNFKLSKVFDPDGR